MVSLVYRHHILGTAKCFLTQYTAYRIRGYGLYHALQKHLHDIIKFLTSRYVRLCERFLVHFPYIGCSATE